MDGNWWFGVENGAVRVLGGWFLGRWLMGEAGLRVSQEPFMYGSTENRARQLKAKLIKILYRIFIFHHFLDTINAFTTEAPTRYSKIFTYLKVLWFFVR